MLIKNLLEEDSRSQQLPIYRTIVEDGKLKITKQN